MSPQIARMVPLAIGSRMTTLSCQRGSSTSSQSCGASSAAHQLAVVGDHRRACDRPESRDRPARRRWGRPGPPTMADRAGAASPRCRDRSRGRAPEPDVGLGIHPLEPQPVEDLLRAHVEPADVDIGPLRLEGVLQQGELVTAVRGIEHDRRPPVVAAGSATDERADRRETGGHEAREEFRASVLLSTDPRQRGSWLAKREQIGEQPERARYTRRQLAEKAEARCRRRCPSPPCATSSPPWSSPRPRRGSRGSGCTRDPSSARSRARAPAPIPPSRAPRCDWGVAAPDFRAPGPSPARARPPRGRGSPAAPRPIGRVGADRPIRADRSLSTAAAHRLEPLSAAGRSAGPPTVSGSGAKLPVKNRCCWYCTISAPPPRT